METYLFTANQAGVDAELALVAGVGSTKTGEYITFERDIEPGDDDWGIYLVLNDQINGAYECIRECVVARDQLQVVLTEPIDWEKRFIQFNVNFDISDDQFIAFSEMLRRIFRDREHLVRFEVK